MQKQLLKQELKQDAGLLKAFIKILLAMYVVSLGLLLLLALALYRTELPPMASKIWLIAIYIVSGFLGGFLIGKRAKSKKFLWGFFIGLSYFIVLLAASLALYRGMPEDWTHLLTTFVLCAAAGTAGGMAS